MSTSHSLSTYREMAAQNSAGISSSSIYITFESILKRNNLQGDLLDFGAGIGNLASRLRKLNRFSSITAVDILHPPKHLGLDICWNVQDLNNPLSFPDESFDVIVSSEVIEHLENPRAVAREWFRLLRSDGFLIFSTPNNESWRAILALIVQGNFVAFGKSSYPAHITALVRQDIEHILQESGFGAISFEFTNVGGIPKIPSLKWSEISGGMLKGLRFSDNILAIAKKVSKV